MQQLSLTLRMSLLFIKISDLLGFFKISNFWSIFENLNNLVVVIVLLIV